MVTNPFPSAAGYNNFPNGVFSPDIFSKEALYFFRQLSIVDEITTSEYEGEISGMGDTVHIRKQPDVTVRTYTRGTNLQIQDLIDEEITLIIDQGNYYNFKMDKVMMQQSDVDYEEMAAEAAAYRIRDAYDIDILEYIRDQVIADNVDGSAGTPKTVGYGTGNDYTPLDAINRLVTLLDEANVPGNGRWFVARPAFYEALSREVSKLIEVQVTGDAQSLIRDKGVLDQSIHGFTMFKTNNAPQDSSSNNLLLAGHVSAVATATQLTENEMLQNPNDFGYIHRGLHVYGRKDLRPSALAKMHITIGDV